MSSAETDGGGGDCFFEGELVDEALLFLAVDFSSSRSCRLPRVVDAVFF